MQHFRMSHLYLSFTKAASSESQKKFGPVFGCVFPKGAVFQSTATDLWSATFCAVWPLGAAHLSLSSHSKTLAQTGQPEMRERMCVLWKGAAAALSNSSRNQREIAGQDRGHPVALRNFFFSRTATGLPLAHHNETTKRWTVRRYSTPAMEHIMKLRNTDQPKYTYVLYIYIYMYVMSMCIYRNIYEYTYIYIYIHLRVMKSRLNTRAHD